MAATTSTATDTAATVVGQADPLAGMLVRTSLGLLVVVVLLLVLAWAARRWGGRWRQQGQVPMQVVGSLALGPRERILVVAVADTWLVVGVSSAGMQTLHTLPAGELPAWIADKNGLGVGIQVGAEGGSGPDTQDSAETGTGFGVRSQNQSGLAGASAVGFTQRLQQALRRRGS